MTPQVSRAIEQIAKQYPNNTVLVGADQNGGACVIVENVPLGAPFAQTETWIGFHITHSCPYADVYPHFARHDLSKVNGSQMGEGISSNHVFPQPGVVTGNIIPSRPAVQISRRSNKRDPSSAVETPLLKLLKVLQWLKSR
jgi:hypothetical protein